MIQDVDLALAFETTWPPAETVDTGMIRSGRGLGAGGRVSSSRALSPEWSVADLAEAEDVHRAWQQPPTFRLPDDDLRLATALSERGYRAGQPTAVMAVDCTVLAEEVPTMTTFAVWPPLSIQRDLWSAGNIGPARQAVMDRVPAPRVSLLGRLDDRAAGAAFVAVEARVAMIHAIEVAPAFRRRGMATLLLRTAAAWAVSQGAGRLGLAVSRSNTNARALYDRLGFRELGGYSYWTRD